MEGPFGFETLSKQEAVERKSPRLTKLEPSFFPELRRYLEILETSHRKEHEKSPTSKRVQFLGDELRNARRKAEALWESRERKIVQFALRNSRAEAPAVALPENLTKEEAPLYEVLLQAFRSQQQRMLPGFGLAAEAAPAPRTPAPAPTTAPAGNGPTPPPPSEKPAPSAEDLETIRALVDIPPFVGFDGKVYRIRKGEVLSLPKRFAKILKDRGQISALG